MGTTITTHVTRRTLLVLLAILISLTIVLGVLAAQEVLEMGASGRALMVSGRNLLAHAHAYTLV